MPSRQERRKAERDAAKRALAQPAGAGGTEPGAADADAAAAALANVDMNAQPLGDWTTQAEDSMALFETLGEEHAYDIVMQRAGGRGLHSFTFQLNLSRF